ncbi:MAG TPA: LrgB family protein [Arenicellales bacterium]|nr:LrgB family protein [Arenicellales bacterium]
MTPELQDIWVYLSTSPLLHLTLTLAAYVAGDWLYEKSGRLPLCNPVLLAVLMLVGLLWLTGTGYHVYFEGAQFVHFMLGPATVALAVPLYRQFSKVRESAVAIVVSLLAGSITAIASVVLVAWALDAAPQTLVSMAPKSVTAPVAMGIAEKLGGLPSLTAVMVIITGVLGATIGASVLRAVRIKDDRARGFALGITSHGIGTARALQMSEVAGAFSALAMGLNALATALLLPLLYRWLVG